MENESIGGGIVGRILRDLFHDLLDSPFGHDPGHLPPFGSPGQFPFGVPFFQVGGFPGAGDDGGFPGAGDDDAPGSPFRSLLGGSSPTVSSAIARTPSQLEFIGGAASVTGSASLYGAADLYKLWAGASNSTVGGGTSGSTTNPTENFLNAASTAGSQFSPQNLASVTLFEPDQTGVVKGYVSLADDTKIFFVDFVNKNHTS